MQGHHIQCGVADLLFSAAHNDQGSHCDEKLSVFVLAFVHDECTQWQPVDWLWQSELPCPALSCSALPCTALPGLALLISALPCSALPCCCPALPGPALPCHAVL